MNIFYLDHDTQTYAEYYNDKNCVKMVLEYAQLLSTAHRVLDGIDYYDETKNGRKIKRWLLPDEREVHLMKASHVNHPSNIWTRKCAENYDWLLDMWVSTCYEFEYRYDKKHKTLERLKYLTNRPNRIIINHSMTEMPQCMPDDCKVEHMPILAYQNFYMKHKRPFCNWTKRPRPIWFT